MRFRRLTAATGWRGAAPPDLPGIFSPKRTGRLAFALLTTPALAAAEPLVLRDGAAPLSVEVAEAAPIVTGGQPGVEFVLTPDAGRAMAEKTGGMIGEELVITVCDIELVRAVVQGRIAGRGTIRLPTVEASVALAEVLRGEAGCESLAAHFPG